MRLAAAGLFTAVAPVLVSGCAADGGVHVTAKFPLGRDGQLGAVGVDVGYFPPDYTLALPDAETIPAILNHTFAPDAKAVVAPSK